MKEMVTFFKKNQLVKSHLLKTSKDPDVRQLYEARCQREYDAMISKNPIKRKTWRPTVEERTCSGAVAHKMRAGVRNSGQNGFGSNSPPWSVDSDETRAEYANMLAEFEEKAEDERYRP